MTDQTNEQSPLAAFDEEVVSHTPDAVNALLSHKVVLGMLGLLVLVMGGLAVLSLSMSNQDVRQYAAEPQTCSATFTVGAAECAGWTTIADPMNRYSAKVGQGVVRAYQDWFSPNRQQISSAVWVNGKGWSRTQNLQAAEGGLPDSSQSQNWSGGSVVAERTPGSGEPQGAGSVTLPDGSLYQVIWKGGVAYERLVPVKDGSLDFSNPSAGYKALSGYAPSGCDGSSVGDTSLWEEYADRNGDGKGEQVSIGEAVWCGDSGFYRSVPVAVNAGGAQFVDRVSSPDWQRAAGSHLYPGSGKIVGVSNATFYVPEGSGMNVGGKKDMYPYGAMQRTVWRYDGTNEYAFLQWIPLNQDGTAKWDATCPL